MPALPTLESLHHVKGKALESLFTWYSGVKSEAWDGVRGGLSRRWWPLFLMLGIAVGMGLKTWASHTVTIGFEDFKANTKRHFLDLNTLEFNQNRSDAAPKDQQYPAESYETQP